MNTWNFEPCPHSLCFCLLPLLWLRITNHTPRDSVHHNLRLHYTLDQTTFSLLLTCLCKVYVFKGSFQTWLENMKERDHLEDLCVDGGESSIEYWISSSSSSLIFMDPCIVDDSVEIPKRCSFVIEFIIPKSIEGSACFERHTAHHQEL